MNKSEALQNIKSIFDKVESTDNKIIKETNDLNIILLNLKIEQAKLHTGNGIKPIAERLENEIKEIREHISKLIEENRELLNESIKSLEE